MSALRHVCFSYFSFDEFLFPFSLGPTQTIDEPSSLRNGRAKAELCLLIARARPACTRGKALSVSTIQETAVLGFLKITGLGEKPCVRQGPFSFGKAPLPGAYFCSEAVAGKGQAHAWRTDNLSRSRIKQQLASLTFERYSTFDFTGYD